MDNSFEDLLLYGECMIYVSPDGMVRSITPFTEEYEEILSTYE